MKSRIIGLTCALTAIACAGADSKPAQDPGSSHNAPPTSENSSTAVAPAADPAAPLPNAAGATTTTANGRETSAAPASFAPSPGAPAAANNPGTPEKNVDNTKVNERDRRSSTLTPMDQGNSGAETKLSAAIRRGIVGDKTLSFNAKNVKVITVGTKVTLRGPVKSDQERAAIEAIAKQTAGVSEVDDQLEVKK